MGRRQHAGLCSCMHLCSGWPCQQTPTPFWCTHLVGGSDAALKELGAAAGSGVNEALHHGLVAYNVGHAVGLLCRLWKAKHTCW